MNEQRIARRKRLLSAIGVAAVIGAFVAPTAAQAVSWGGVSAWYGDELRASGSGNFVNSGNVSAKQTATFRTWSANPGYNYTNVLFWQYSSTSGTNIWYNGGKTISLTSSANTLTTKSGSVTLSANGSRARGETKVCEQTPWYNPDVCSPTAIPTFDY